MSGAEKCHCSSVARSSQFTVRDVGREGSDDEVSCEGAELGTEKLPWLVVEVEVGAERAGCFAERQVRLGLVGEEAIPETRDRLGSPVERTKWSQKVRFGADRGDGAAPLSCEVAWWIHGAPARLWVPPHLKSDTLC